MVQQCRQQQEPTEASQAFTPNRRRNPRRKRRGGCQVSDVVIFGSDNFHLYDAVLELAQHVPNLALWIDTSTTGIIKLGKARLLKMFDNKPGLRGHTVSAVFSTQPLVSKLPLLTSQRVGLGREYILK